MRAYTSLYLTPTVPTNLSITQCLATTNPDSVLASKIILEDDQSGKSFTCTGLRARAGEEGYAWKMRDLEEGDVVRICGVNCVNCVNSYPLCVWKWGGGKLFSAVSTVSDFVHAFSIVKPRFIIVDPGTIKKLRLALGQVVRREKTKIIIHLTDTDNHPQLNQLIRYPRDFFINVRLTIPIPSGKDSINTIGLIFFSSGASSLQKAVCITYHALIASLACMRSSDPSFYSSNSSSVFLTPLCHIYGLNTVVLMTSWLGAYTMLMKSYELGRFLRLSEEKKANALRIVPSIAVKMAEEGVLDGYELESARFVLCSGGKLEEGGPICQGYGEARLVDDDMNDVEPGQAGELLIRGPTIFRYSSPTSLLSSLHLTGRSRSNTEAFHNGWLKTGDILRIDNEGFLSLVERKKEIIKYKGLQISPTELEALLVTHRLVLEAAVCAKWDKEQGTELPIAYIVLNPLGLRDLNTTVKVMICYHVRKWFDERVGGYKRLSGGVQAVDAIPKTALGKVIRWKLPARLEMEKENEEMGARL
ncbi:acetyl-CoA synthetase-like protein [Acephala macrosclerotiorum]|nr:acetyl-CoA synthetase-like protein [Acephala macrosclerotiorum]